ncbi:hypothetical protein T06_13428 [Trichinella sp. T6]|nr:hypothetical protein T06_13428 [Trichinella sp. T6]
MEEPILTPPRSSPVCCPARQGELGMASPPFPSQWPITGPIPVGILEKRFGRPKIVARAHFLALWKAPTCLSTDLRYLAMGKDPHAGELPLSEAVMPGLKEKFPRALQRVWYLKVGAGPESEDNLEFDQLQVNSLSPTGDPGLEE